MIAVELFKFNDCVEGEIKAVFVVSFLPKPVKCVTGLSSGSPIGSFNIPTPPPPSNSTRHFNRKCQGCPALYTCFNSVV